MNNRENILCAVRFERPGYIPISFNLVGKVCIELDIKY
jgi:hypothetical protein